MTKRTFLLKKARISILTVAAMFIGHFAFSQGYYHGLGGQYNYGIFKLESASFSDSSNPAVPGVFYKATIGLSETFAISAYPFIGFSGSANSRTGGSGSVGIQIPIVAELYFGEMDDACFFLGGGISYASLGSTEGGSGKAFGPQLSLGGQFEIAGQLIGLRAGYTYGINKTKDLGVVEFTKDTHNVISIGAYYML